MKQRNGFVSNSSSSSFILDVGGEPVEADYSDFGLYFFTCENGHNLHESDLVFTDKAIEILRELTGKQVSIYDDYDEDKLNILRELCGDQKFEEGNAIPSAFCPICEYQIITDKDALWAALAETGRNLDEQKKYLRKRFKNFSELSKFIAGDPREKA